MITDVATMTTCMQCQVSLENVGTWTTYDKKHKPVRVICDKCFVREQYNNWVTTGVLRTQLLTEAVLVSMYNENVDTWKGARAALERAALSAEEAATLTQVNDELRDLTSTIETNIWFERGLQKWVRASNYKGARLNLGDGDVLLIYAMAGRCRLSLQTSKGEHLTVQCDETAPLHPEQGTMGVIGIDASRETAKALVEKLLSVFDEKNVRKDTKVGIF